MFPRAVAAHYNYGCNSPDCCWGGSSFDDDKPCYCRSCLCSRIEGPVGTGQTCPCEDQPPGCPPPCCANGFSGFTSPFGFSLQANYYFGCGMRDYGAVCGSECEAYAGNLNDCFGNFERCYTCNTCTGPFLSECPTYGKVKVHGPYEDGIVPDQNCEPPDCCPTCNFNCVPPTPTCEATGRDCKCEDLMVYGGASAYFIGFTDVQGCGLNVQLTGYQQCGQSPCTHCGTIGGAVCDIPLPPPSDSKDRTDRFTFPEDKPDRRKFPHYPIGAKERSGLRLRPTFNIRRFFDRQPRLRKPKLSEINFGSSSRSIFSEVSGSLTNQKITEELFEKNFVGRRVLNLDYLDGMSTGETAVVNRNRNKDDSFATTYYFQKRNDGEVDANYMNTSIDEIPFNRKKRSQLLRVHKKLMRNNEEYAAAYRSAGGCEDGLIPGNRIVLRNMPRFRNQENTEYIDDLEGGFMIYDPRGICITPDQANCTTAQVYSISASAGQAKLKYGSNCNHDPTSQYGICGWDCECGLDAKCSNQLTGGQHAEYYFNYSDNVLDPPDFRSFARWGIGAALSEDCGGFNAPYPGNGTYCSDRKVSGPEVCFAPDPTYGDNVLVHARHYYYQAPQIVLFGSQYAAGGSPCISGFPPEIPARC